MRKSYDTNRVVRKARRLFGEPTHREGGTLIWSLGGSVLRVYALASKPLRCHVGYIGYTGPHYAGDPYTSSTRLTVDRIFTGFSQCACLCLDGEGRVALILGKDGQPKLFNTPRRLCETGLPDALIPLAWRALRGELEPALFLDAVKHDTEILG